MAEFTTPTRQVARKDHKCNFCLQTIQKGTQYEKHAGFDSGTAWTWKNHVRCSALANITGMYREAMPEGLTTEDFIESCKYLYEKESGNNSKDVKFIEVMDFLYKRFNV